MANQEWMDLAKMDPELEKILKNMPPMPPIIQAGGVQKARQALRERKAALVATMGPVDDTGLDISHQSIPARDGYQIPIRVYKPTSPPSNGGPLIVFFHGGGFCLGDLDGEDLNCRNFCRKFGATVVNVEYRLAPEHPFPYAPNDSWDALQWAAANATTTLSANPSTGFIVGGTSAGGNLSAVCAVLARDNKLSPPLTGVCLLIPAVLDAYNPPAAHADELQSFDQNRDAPFLNRANMDAMVGPAGYNYDGQSPLINLYSEREPTSRAGLPPVFFEVCGLDPLRDEALLFERELRTVHGTKTKLKVYPGLPHSFWSAFPMLEQSKGWLADTEEGMRWLLDGGK